MSDSPTPLTILTGFLGAGKTTLLNRILHGDHGLKIAVMVNDFGAVNIDSQLVVDVDADDTVSLSNGCICCTIRGDFLEATLKLLNRTDKPEYIVVETSGVSDPIDVALTFKHVPDVRIDSVLTVIDAEQILDIEQEHAVLAMNQIGMADIVILNKVDLIDETQRKRVHKYIREISKDARILETVNANAPLDLILNVGDYDFDRALSLQAEHVHVHDIGEDEDETHDHDHNHALVFSTWSWQSDDPLSFKALKRTVENLPTAIYRAKGIFYLAESPDLPAILQVVGKRAHLTISETGWNAELPHSQFVVIGTHNGFSEDDLRAEMENCLASNAKSDLERFASNAFGWLRKRAKKED
ncbi:MAG: GTP-binding protein [Aggregatilineales bacterium]